MKARNIGAIIITLGLLAVSCSQDAIFDKISNETKPLKPRLEGGPSNMVVFQRGSVPIMLVASGKLHWYAKAQWDSSEYGIPQPWGKISALAVAGECLYALGWDSQGVTMLLQYIKSDGYTWIPFSFGVINANPSLTTAIQSIYADPSQNWLFAGVSRSTGTGRTYDIQYWNHTTPKQGLLKERTGELTGVVFKEGYYYLCTNGYGIYRVSETDLENDTINETTVIQLDDISAIPNRMFTSMIKLDDKNETIIAVERGKREEDAAKGKLYKVNETGFEPMQYSIGGEVSIGYYSTGALALWENNGLKLLIAGIQDELYYTSHTYGYVEFRLEDNDSYDISARYLPGNLLSIIDANHGQYTGSLGKYSVNHLFQAPKEIDPNMTFFASTQTQGLWSYRVRNGIWQWNAEE